MKRDQAASPARRELLEALDAVLQTLGAQRLSDEAVHSARKTIKKARACLRLLRESLSEDVYSTENVALRDAGRILAPLRNAKSLAEAFNAFRDRYPLELRGSRFDALADHLHAVLLAEHRTLVRAPARLRECIEALAACHARVARWKGINVDAAAVAAGVRRIFRTGRKALDAARRHGTPDALHEWRKQVKYLSNALKILDGSGDCVAEMGRRAGKLTDRLGEDHDLAELARHLAEGSRPAIDNAARDELTRLINRRSAKLQRRAYALGAKLYNQKPRQFTAGLTPSAVMHA